jgi:predicted  nucleic acid-binding Zn-ribbon protein
MRVRGERECRDCGTRWSYYESGSIECPDCGSIRSRGVAEQRQLHTAGAATLDLDVVRQTVEERPLQETVAAAKEAAREYVRQDGFVRGGDLLALDDVHLAARELVHVADLVGRSTALSDGAARYLLALLRGADAGERPDPETVPVAMRSARGLAAAEGVRAYRRELRDWLEEHPHPAVREPLGRLDQHGKRLEALQGEVPPAAAERLVAATRDLSEYLRAGEDDALARATDRLDRMAAFRED